MLAVSVELKFTTMYLEMNIQLESSLEKKLILMNKWLYIGGMCCLEAKLKNMPFP